ncbi:endo alpha-1,4 polygalactosaminidase [Streptomyces sp. NBC_00201]|uniref:endo alpha-1,4 polygalactosaminidase n=1 Tax=unclassified Streptomyces TaxID=2593676 RepID=UPI00225567B2|nr:MULTISPECIES: endo alpha-1,4 polygalactosaminidase [unclassified Streptomyces]MCX5251483.1 endo alpha-1,4 polygalactosaminidase [Streptomyces sp. NBC_00201]MCX5294593.1 endo alpha-1,4 polygalactosaminidase [Streptomyces sp. NBC_00183]
MPTKGVSRVGGLGTAVGACVLLAAALSACGSSGGESAGTSKPSAELQLPPRRAGFDYQIGGAYPPPPGTRVVSRDRTASPAPGLYNVCYVNAFQSQPDERTSWPSDLLLRDGQGKVVVDGDWGEALLDIRTPAKRQRVAARVNRWIDGCAAKGFDAVEPDNYDSYTRSRHLLTADDATAFVTLLSRHAHARHLAIGQKNTVELAGLRKRTGLDFAVAEECAEHDECGAYAKAFDDRVLVIEYSDTGLRKARTGFGDRLSIVRRDVMVSTPGSDDYVRRVR